jgi:hypothetical protein
MAYWVFKEDLMKHFAFGLLLLFAVSFSYAQTPPDTIMSPGTLSPDTMVSFLLENNRWLNRDSVGQIVDFYILQANAEGVNYEIAFAQMCYHTKYLSFAGTFAKAGSNNFFGLSGFHSTNVAYSFDTYQRGIIAHIQHLKGYASRDRLNSICEDPRYYRIEEAFGWGSSPTIDELSGRWAGPDYAAKIKYVLLMLYARVQ